MAMTPLPFGKYLLVERIAQGGMAEVYRALLRGPGGFEKTVALKRILPGFSTMPDFVSRFMDEARLAAGLTHVNVVHVFDFGEVDGSYYLAMELVDGVDLGRLHEGARRMGEPLPLASSVFVAAEAARGLAYAHTRSEGGQPLGIVHRDISPQNILVSYAGEVKIADFGIAKATAALHKMAHQSASGAMMGKLRYMSPEQVAGEPLDGRSDVFALGVVLWEALVGRPLIDADSPAAAVEQVKRAEFAPPSARAPAVPPDLDRIVLKALARDRDARYERAADLARDLTLLLNERAPGFSREDLGAFVERVAPRKRDEGERPDAPGEADEPVSPLAATAPDRPRSPSPRAAAGKLAASAATRREGLEPTRPSPPKGWKRRTAAVAAVTLVVGLAGGAAVRWRKPSVALPPRADGGAVVLAQADAGAARADAAVEKPADPLRARLLRELRETKRAGVTVRGVASSPEYRAVMSAVDAALCATPVGRDDPVFPADVEEPLRSLELAPEATALARYLLAVGELPAEEAGALDALLRHGPAWAPGSDGYAVATLAALQHPDDPRYALELLRQHGALGRWSDGQPTRKPELCERREAVARLDRIAPDGRLTRTLDRFLHAPPPGVAVDTRGLRFQVVGAERSAEAQTLSVVVKVTNPSAQPAEVGLQAARLAGHPNAPALDPDLPTLPANSFREVRLTFEAVDDDLADGAVLDLGAGAALQAYSEVLR